MDSGRDGPDDEDKVAVGRDADLDVAAECRAHPRRDLCASPPGRQRRRPAGVAVQVAVLARRWPGPVRVHQRIAARRLADRTVLERIGPGDDPEATATATKPSHAASAHQGWRALHRPIDATDLTRRV